MKTNELKACPCGKPVEIVTYQIGQHQIAHSNTSGLDKFCHFTGPIRGNKKKLIKDWNNRPGEDKAKDQELIEYARWLLDNIRIPCSDSIRDFKIEKGIE